MDFSSTKFSRGLSVKDVNQRNFSGKPDGFTLIVRRVLKGDRILLPSTGLERER